MPVKTNDTLFVLIKSLTKSEKRNFKLFATRNAPAENLKTVVLFDALDKMLVYNEKQLLDKNKEISKLQLSNLKASLYRQILSSLRVMRHETNVEMMLQEGMDFARILFNKGLFLQCLKQLDKLKEMAAGYHQNTILQQVLFFEKKIEALYITRSVQNRAETLIQESLQAEQTVSLINRLSNLSLHLYSWYLDNGHARNLHDIKSIELFYKTHLPALPAPLTGFYEQMYLHQAQCWLAFLKLDFVKYYRHAQKWVDLFRNQPKMIIVETASYIKGLHNLTSSLFYLVQADKLKEVIHLMDRFLEEKIVTENENNTILVYQYLFTAKINYYFLLGRFDKGIKMVPFLEKMLEQYGPYLDRHRVMVFYYKIACLYFGSGNNDEAINYLNRIIHQKADLRNDLQCYSRLLHLIAHYELGNFELLKYLSKSVYRFMAKMENLSKVEIEIFRFLQQAFKVEAHAIKPQFEKLLARLKKLQNNPLESRAFAYLDIISWLESKINGVEVQNIIRDKYLKDKRIKGRYEVTATGLQKK